MRFIKHCLICILVLGISVPVLSQGDLVTQEEIKKDAAKVSANSDMIIFFPFYDYTGSSLKYLSYYIPEVIIEKITLEEGIRIYDLKKLKAGLEKNNISPESLYDDQNALKYLKEMNAAFGLVGRYIIQGKTILIDFYIINAGSGKITKGVPYEGIMDDDLLGTIDRFTVKCTEWMKVEALSDIISRLDIKKKSLVSRKFESIKESRIGYIFKNKWLFSLFILIVFYFLSKLMVVFFEKILGRVAGKTDTTVDDELIAISKKPVKWVLIFVGIKLALVPLKMEASTVLFFSNLTTAFMIAFVTYLVFKVAEILIHFWGTKVAEKLDSRIDDDLVPLFVKISKVFILIMGFLLIMSKFGVEIGPLVASLGIAGFAIGFAVKDSLANVIGGVILILDKSFVVGDKVQIDSDVGVITEVGLRNTKLQTYDNEVIVIPNGELMNKKFKNYVLPDPKIRVVVNFGVAYGTDVDRVEEVIMGVIRGIDDVTEDPAPQVVFIEMADFSLNFQAKFWIPMYENQYNKKVEATKKIYKALNEAKINIPFPTHTVYIEKE